MLFRKLGAFTLLSCTATSAAAAQHTMLDVTTLPAYADYAPAPQTLGDHGNLNVTNRTRFDFGNTAVACSYAEMWNAGYAGLNGALLACGNTRVAELHFQPGVGKQVTLNSLFVGTYYQNLSMSVQVFDGAWNQLFTFAGVITNAQQLTPNVTSTNGLYLQWGTNWNTGVNLIETTVSDIPGGPSDPPTTTAPEPATFVLMASGLGVVAMMRRRRTN